MYILKAEPALDVLVEEACQFPLNEFARLVSQLSQFYDAQYLVAFLSESSGMRPKLCQISNPAYASTCKLQSFGARIFIVKQALL